MQLTDYRPHRPPISLVSIRPYARIRLSRFLTIREVQLVNFRPPANLGTRNHATWPSMLTVGIDPDLQIILARYRQYATSLCIRVKLIQIRLVKGIEASREKSLWKFVLSTKLKMLSQS